MKLEMARHAYPPFRLKPDRERARQFLHALGTDAGKDVVPPTYLIFLRGESRGVDLFSDLGIPREKALHGGQRYEWFAPVSFDDELSVIATVGNITTKEGKRGTIWFVDVTFEYYRLRDDVRAVREVTRLIQQS